MEAQYHIKCSVGDVGKYVIMPGDPDRCDKIAEYLESPYFVRQNREYRIFNGYLDGELVTVCSTGIGGPSAAIALEELANIGADTFIRIGTCGGIREDVRGGDICIAMSAVRQDGTSYEYAPEGYPATADFDTVCALSQAADALGCKKHIGVVQAKDSFYGQHSPAVKPVSSMLLEKWEAWKRLGVLCSEMESAAMFTVAAFRRVRCGSVFSVVWNQEIEQTIGGDHRNEDTSLAIKCAVEAVRILIDRDRSAK